MNHSEPQEQPSPLFVSSPWLDKDYVSPQRFALGTKANRVLPPPLGVERAEPASPVATTSPEVAEHSERSEASPSLVGSTPSAHTQGLSLACGGWLRELCSHGLVQWAPLKCHKWQCEICGPGKRMEFLERLNGAMRLSRLQGWTLKFVTLTWSADVDKKRVRWDLAHLVQGIRRRYGYCEYAKVPELTRRGRVHLHLSMVMPYIPQRILSSMWKSYAKAPIVDIRAVTNAYQLLNELAKYLVKRPAAKVTYSRQFPAAEPRVRVRSGPCDACGGTEHIFQHITVSEAETNFPCEVEGRRLGEPVTPLGVLRRCDCWPVPT